MYDGAPYFARAVSYVCKMFIKSTTGAKVIKLFPSLTILLRQNKLGCLPLATWQLKNTPAHFAAACVTNEATSNSALRHSA
jgi:hypothetical protein